MISFFFLKIESLTGWKKSKGVKQKSSRIHGNILAREIKNNVIISVVITLQEMLRCVQITPSPLYTPSVTLFNIIHGTTLKFLF